MSLRELWNEFIVARRVARQRWQRDVHLAWTIEWMARQEKLSARSMRVLLDPTRRQSPREQFAVMQQIAALTGRQLEFRPAPQTHA
ncbi:MAG TPA: hypothetical protein VE665_02435 [Hyphomicrobiaceae bacterium]|nr:hypothetical protein [Hyphomicrobiaceae bacterium]